MTTELLSEMTWRDKAVPNLTEWISQYLWRRYGKSNDEALNAWTILSQRVLNSHVRHFNQKVLLINGMPRLNMTDFRWYPLEDVGQAWDHMMKAVPDLQNEPGFR